MLEEREGLGIVERDRVEVDGDAPAGLHVLGGVAQDRQRAQPQHVELHQPHLFDDALVPADDRALVAIAHDTALRQRDAGDDHAGRVLACPAHPADELAGIAVDERILRQQRLHGIGGEDLFLRGQAVHRGGRHVGLAVIDAEDPRNVLDRALRAEQGVGGDPGDVFLAEALAHIGQHLVAALVLEVDVDVREIDAARAVEALEQQAMLERVDRGDADQVADERTARRAAAGADGDAGTLGPIHHVLEHQEVG